MTNGSQAERLKKFSKMEIYWNGSLRVTAKAQREPASGRLGTSSNTLNTRHGECGWCKAGSADPLNLMVMASGHTRHNTVSNDRLNLSRRGSVSRVNSPMSMPMLISHAAALSFDPHYLRREMARFHSVAIQYEQPHDRRLRDKEMSEPQTTPYASSHEVIETMCLDTLLRLSHRMTGRERSFLPLRRYSHSSTHELSVFAVLLLQQPYQSIGTAL
ncbi:uncharacterized protein BO88DRAFT_421429 [Aspergillus vadensis CBS 113365]|uniref:Uncharacterized protein n=1 Tax=Aspergillus vadensis (strain CBS 113365 / IMI 142717 / IBT 24658) TaxID=1448311 RepID=A0A319C9H3_ASPVC|nr:hypothetical protein BO88DRAFT_421429 [Aspergillus vadensis CBS 113365]PYH75123.1 hypothetical protein BO88DRAFT_421429 [Aspergillus vadensis CBS 113365]